MFYQVLYDVVNDLCNFHDLYTSLSVTFVMYFNGRNKDLYYHYLFIIIITSKLNCTRTFNNGPSLIKSLPKIRETAFTFIYH